MIDVSNISVVDTTFPLPVDKKNIVVQVSVTGDPVAHQRPRFGKGHTYTPKASRDYKELLAWEIKTKGPQLKIEGPLGAQALFFRSNRQRIDVDNLLKSVLDACTLAGLWNDDSQVREVAARVWLAQSEPHVEFVIYHLQDETYDPIKKCAHCDKPFQSYPSDRNRRVYCSRACAYAAKRVLLKCEECGKEYELPRSLANQLGGRKKTGQRRFCSRECSISAWRKLKRKIGKESDKWICSICGGRVSRKEYKVCRACSMKTRNDPNGNYWKLRHTKGFTKERIAA